MSDIKTDVERIKAKILNYEFITESDAEDLLTTIESQNSQIESLKAITELAVNELRLQLCAANVWGMDGTIKSIQTTLSEIEKLQNE